MVSNMTERRKFLQGLAAISAAYVIPGSAMKVAHQASHCLDSWPSFIKTNKEKYPCVLVMEFSLLYHDQLLKLSQTKSRSLTALFSKVPGLVMDRPQITRHLKNNNLNSNIFLVSLDGKVLKQGKLDYTQLNDSRQLTKSLEQFFYSDKALAKAWQAFSPNDKNEELMLGKQLAIFENGGYRQRASARKAICHKLKKNLWGLAQCARTSQSIEQRETCRDLLISYKSKTPLLYGVPAQGSRHLGVTFKCGMASMPSESRHFVEQIALLS
jgi:hypothetical protein